MCLLQHSVQGIEEQLLNRVGFIIHASVSVLCRSMRLSFSLSACALHLHHLPVSQSPFPSLILKSFSKLIIYIYA